MVSAEIYNGFNSDIEAEKALLSPAAQVLYADNLARAHEYLNEVRAGSNPADLEEVANLPNDFNNLWMRFYDTYTLAETPYNAFYRHPALHTGGCNRPGSELIRRFSVGSHTDIATPPSLDDLEDVAFDPLFADTGIVAGWYASQRSGSGATASLSAERIGVTLTLYELLEQSGDTMLATGATPEQLQDLLR